MAPQPHIVIKPQANFRAFSPEKVFLSARPAATWGVFAGITALFVLSNVPLVKKDVLSNIPFVGRYWKVEESA
ncbi:hypothetical protein H4219_002340 [Mycoemilia scoparia]|uniref:Uncharacterized protein n=1 Tax=Mycoemilia scoparia TaxID=417184 RepID=A0A9W8A1G5_9FUNG|nr:hypothetical protein H4219_002340 [Mycoemilia scoparia]